MVQMINKLLSPYELDHIGIAVSKLSEVMPLYQALGFLEAPVEEVKSEKVRVAMYELGNQARIELLEPTSEESTLFRFLEKRGSGIHHICLRVSNIKELLVQLKNKGVRLIYDQPQPGAHHCLISFIHPASTGGVLIELSQKLNQGER